MGMHKLEYCKAGLHELKGHNAVPHADGSRECRACRVVTRRKKRAEKKALLDKVKQEARIGKQL